MDKFQKILNRAIERSRLPLDAPHNGHLYINGYHISEILDSPALQDKLYDLFFPPSTTVKGIRTMKIEDIRSR